MLRCWAQTHALTWLLLPGCSFHCGDSAMSAGSSSELESFRSVRRRRSKRMRQRKHETTIPSQAFSSPISPSSMSSPPMSERVRFEVRVRDAPGPAPKIACMGDATSDEGVDELNGGFCDHVNQKVQKAEACNLTISRLLLPQQSLLLPLRLSPKMTLTQTMALQVLRPLPLRTYCTVHNIQPQVKTCASHRPHAIVRMRSRTAAQHMPCCITPDWFKVVVRQCLCGRGTLIVVIPEQPAQQIKGLAIKYKHRHAR